MTQRQKDSLALPSAEHQAVESGQAGVETWKYKAKNSLMYYPEGERGTGPLGWTASGVCVSLLPTLWAFRGPDSQGQVGVCVGGVSTDVQPTPAAPRLCSMGPSSPP